MDASNGKTQQSSYKKIITGKTYRSELVNTYQKRFVRYQESLFTFLDYDGIPWHNNKAENAIRHIARQKRYLALSLNLLLTPISCYSG